jgi:hypothetical protein
MGPFGKLLTAAKAVIKCHETSQQSATSTSSLSEVNASEGENERIAQKRAIYSNATLPSGQIRVLEPVGTKAHCYRLSQVGLDSNPIYDALSYVWGASAHDAIIKVDGKPFPVTKHLKAAMNRLSMGTSQAFWIDAICIDQTNNPERNAQVRQMTRIYEGARRVLVWLGDAENHSDRAFDLLESFKSPNVEKFAKAVIKSFVSKSQTNGWLALASLLARPWWTRAWIFQELLVASKADIWCGSRSCPWETFSALAFVLEEHRGSFVFAKDQAQAVAEVMTNHHHLYNLAVYQRQRKLLCPPSLLQALQMRRQAAATDPRDKVYSLLGVCREEQASPREFRSGFILTSGQRPSPPEGFDVRIEYDQSHTIAEVYKGVARHIMRKCEHLEILSACQNPERSNGIPSWAPDWSTPRVNGPIVVPDTWGRIYSACGEKKLNLRQSSDPDEIILDGILVEIIKKVGPPRRHGWSELEYPWARMSLECAKALPDGTKLEPAGPIQNDAHCLYRTGERIREAFLRTCVMDRIEEFRGRSGHHIDQLDLSGRLGSRETIARFDATENRRFAITDGGFMGLVPLETKQGDKVVVLAGADVPFIIRTISDDRNVIVGESYLHGFMNGEIFDLVISSAEHKGQRVEPFIFR